MKDDPRARKRRGPRVVGPFKARWCGALTVPLMIHDLSVGGCLVLSSNMALPNKLMTLEIDVPGEECITVQGQPLYIRANVGFAVKFVNVSEATDQRLQRVVARLASSAGQRPR